MSPREARVIRNAELFRQVNMHIAELQEGPHNLFKERLPLVCECDHTGCTTPIEVELATFEQVREKPLQFLVAPGHEDVDTDGVIDRREGYLIVEKLST